MMQNMKTESRRTKPTAEPQSPQHGGNTPGVRPEAERHAAFGRTGSARKAVSPLRSATAVHKLAALLLCLSGLTPLGLAGATNDLTSALQKGLFEEEANHNLDAAAQAYQAVSAQFDKDRKLAATAIFRLGEVYRKQGRTNEATAQYERIVREFSDQQSLATLSRQSLAGLNTSNSTANAAKDGAAGSPGVGGISEEASRLAAQLAGIEKLNVDPEKQAQAVLAFFPDDQLRSMLEHLPQLRDQEARYKADPNMKQSATFVAIGGEELRADAAKPSGLPRASEEVQRQLKYIAQRVEVILGIQKARLEVYQTMIATVPAQGTQGSFESRVVTDDEEKEIRRIQEMIKNSPDLINAPAAGGGPTPLCNAARLGQLRVAKFLLDAGAVVDLPSGGSSPIHNAAAGGHKAMVELLLDRGADVNARDVSGKTALHLAAENGFQSVVEALLARKADVNAPTKRHETPLSLAAAKGHGALVELLLAKGAQTEAKAENGWTALMGAAFEGHAEVVKRLLAAKAESNAQDNSGRTVLSYAVERGRVEVVKPLLEAKADPNAGQKDLPLATAARFKQVEIAGLLLNAGAKPDLASKMPRAVVPPGQSEQGWGSGPFTPLQIAVSQGDAAMVKLLFKFKADANAKDPWFGAQAKPLVFYALANVEMLNAFLDAGADPDARDNTRPVIVAATELDASRVEPLIARGANVNVRGSFGNWREVTPLQVAAIKGDLKSVELLLNAKAEANAATPEGWTALHQAAYHGSKEIVELLLAHGADINAKGQNGDTPLHWAVGAVSGIGAQKMVELLLSKGADPNIRGSNGWTPLDRAKGAGYASRPALSLEIAATLREHGALDDLPDFNSILVTRAGVAQPIGVFMKDTNSVNRFTLLEVMRNYYPEHVPSGLPFPDFSKIIIHRPIAGKPGEKKEITVNLLTVTNSFDCSKDTWLEFGDVVEIPEREHTLAEQPIGLTVAQSQELTHCLEGNVTFVVRGQKAQFKLNGMQYTCRFQSALSGVQNLLRSSSDLSHIKIKRTDPATGKTNEIIADSKISQQNNIWLRNGDVIEVPDKP
jgi:ankyrin repeat protein